MKKMQQALGKKLEQMKEQMGKGANKDRLGKQKPGGMSKDLAQMAAQQAALRKMAQQKAKQLNEDGSGKGNQMGDIAKEMEEIERDLVNRRSIKPPFSVNKTSSPGCSKRRMPNGFAGKKRSAPPKQATTR